MLPNHCQARVLIYAGLPKAHTATSTYELSRQPTSDAYGREREACLSLIDGGRENRHLPETDRETAVALSLLGQGHYEAQPLPASPRAVDRTQSVPEGDDRDELKARGARSWK
jgi:hypothetical protein